MRGSLQIRQVWVIQCVSTGDFLTSELCYCSSLKGAGRLFDLEQVQETAVDSLEDDFEIHTFYEVEKLQDVFQYY